MLGSASTSCSCHHHVHSSTSLHLPPRRHTSPLPPPGLAAGPIPNSIWRSGGASAESDIATIAIMPAGVPAGAGAAATAQHCAAARHLALALKEALQAYGPVLQLNSSNMRSRFPGAFTRLQVLFYRSKITSWMAAQEEEYRWAGLRGWSAVCGVR